MANARTVEEVPISEKTRTKTSIFWSIVPETEQFRNVQVPGVALDRLKDVKKNTQSQKYAQVVQKSKSDSATLSTRSHPVNNQGKTGHKFAVKENDLSDKNSDASSIIKGASNDPLANMSTLSESTKARRASLKNLNVEDKKRVANLIKELAKTGEEREFALERLQEERVSFDEQLSAVQEEQKSLKLEREALKQRLEKSEKLLKKYESELKDVKTEKEEQDKILKKKFYVQPQSTQTSPLQIQNFSTDGIQPRGTKKTLSTQAYIGDSESNDRDGRRQWSKPQVPVYSNSLFDVKVSNVEHSETRSVSEECQRSSIMENGSLHELYLREYSLQLRLQEQQIEIQRQQVQLQQQLQLLQQQQQQQQPQLTKPHTPQEQQNKELQQGLTQQQKKHNQQHFYQQNQEPHVHHQHQPLEYKEKHSNADHKHKKQEWQKQTTQQTRPSRELQPLNQTQNWQEQDPQYPNEQRIEEIFKQSSPTQQTNLLQKRTPERKGQQVEAKQADTNGPHDHADHSPRLRHEHHHSVVENSRLQQYEDVFDGQYGEPQKKDRTYTSSSSPSRRYFHHSGHDVEKNRFAVEHQTNRNKSQHGTDGTSFKQRHMSKGKSPRKHVDLNNNEYFQRKSNGRQKNRYDIDDNLVHDHYPQEYLSESYSEPDNHVEQHYNSERPCHCGYYHNHAQRQPVTLDYGQPMSNHSHSRSIPKHRPKSPYGIIKKLSQMGEPHHAQIYQQPHRQQHSPDNSYRQRSLHDSMHIRIPEHIRSSGDHLHKGEYHHRPDIREEHHAVPHHGAPHYVTHKHERESEYAVNTNQPTERRTYTRHQLRSPTGVLLSPQVGKTEHDHLSSEGLQHSRSQVDRSKYLLDDYIYNHRTQNNTEKSNTGYEPRDTSNKHPIKRKISRKSHGNIEIEREENGHPEMLYMTSEQRQYEDENPNPSYSLYKQTVPHLTREQPGYPKTPLGRKYDSRKRYPNSLVEIVEDLEINSEYEERYSEETEMCSTEEPGYDSDEEESIVLDNIFFLKR